MTEIIETLNNQNPGQAHQPEGPAPQEKKFTQEELNDIIAKRLQRERKSWEKELADAKAKADLEEVERIKLEKLELEDQMKQSNQAMQNKLIQTEAKAQALALGINVKKLPYVLKLADLSADVVLDESGDVDEAQIKTAIEAVINELPELVEKRKAAPKAGTEFKDKNSKVMTKEEFNKLSYKERIDLFNTNPELYKSLSK